MTVSMKKYLSLATFVVGAALANTAFANPGNGHGNGNGNGNGHGHGPDPVPVWTVETTAIKISGDKGSISLGGHTFTFTDSVAAPVQLAYYNSNPGSNSPAAISSFIEGSGKFGLTTNTHLNLGAFDDIRSGSALIAKQDNPYDYLAVHVGGGELLFHWSSKVTTAFSITGDNLSNYRAYISPVPEPETYAMLLAGFGVLGFMVRRRKQQ